MLGGFVLFALANFPQMAGSASALFGFMQMSLAAVAGMLVGRFHTGTSLTMSLVIAASGLSAIAVHQLLSRRHPASGFAAPSGTRGRGSA